jgi:hypothetical protein
MSGDAPHLDMINLIAGGIPRQRGVLPTARGSSCRRTPSARMCRASSRTPSLLLPAAAGSRVPVRPRYGRGPALPEPQAHAARAMLLHWSGWTRGDRGHGRLPIAEAHDRIGGKPCPVQTCRTSRPSWADQAVLAAQGRLLSGSQLLQLGLIVALRTLGRQGFRHQQARRPAHGHCGSY